ncbi:MAG: 23S rRNA (pseudouridine(1915)-N(3))-methyltransferase RlmH [Syntrophomonadaceae bacterium]|nr:23S rRNA (pseudouridine(1915)-N(3))-methyltransferase RlmH [Syntrophomonadaceae bacterium]MDD3024222.1 23S rRNA (pseudouridine(1915)-N(3))-methyltransferase RlmH [Syntrophomonadaceae bacterium]
MKYRIISVGKIREPFYLEGINEYLKRLGPYTNIELLDGLEEKISPRASEKEIQKFLKKEGDKILNLLGKDEIVVVLDIKGMQLTSEGLAEQITVWNTSGKSRINLIIGDAYGLCDEVKKRADYKISFSHMTFPHQMAVLILTEQIYRGFKILKGEPYHH